MRVAADEAPTGGRDDDGITWLPRRGERPAPRMVARSLASRPPARPDAGAKGSAARTIGICSVLAGLAAFGLVRADGSLSPATVAHASTIEPAALVSSAPPGVLAAALAPPLSASTGPTVEEAIAAVSLPLPEVTREDLVAVVAPAEARDPDELLAFGPMRIRRWLVETIVRAASETRTDPVLLMAIADKESSFSTRVRATTSSAEGLFQFIEQTWLKVVRQYGESHGMSAEAAAIVPGDDGFEVADPALRARILERRRDPYLSALLAAEMLKGDSARIARRIGRDLTHGEVYIAHFLGPDDAGDFLAKVAGSPKAVAAKLLPRPARANRPIFYAGRGRKAKGLSVAEVHRKFEDMIGLRTSRYSDVPKVAGLMAYASAEPPAP